MERRFEDFVPGIAAVNLQGIFNPPWTKGYLW